jgi:hypothetical protein
MDAPEMDRILNHKHKCSERLTLSVAHVRHYTAKESVKRLRSADQHDILTAAMHRRHLQILCAVLVVSTVIALTVLSSISASALHTASVFVPAPKLQAATPTPAQADGSRAGSTDGIMWMGIAIVLIVILPIVLNKQTWTRS